MKSPDEKKSDFSKKENPEPFSKKENLNQEHSDPEVKSWKTSETAKEQFSEEKNIRNEEPINLKEQYGPSPFTANDRWAETDTLGYWVYVHAIYNFLIHPKTKAPLTVSIQAPWGGGKTSIMRMIQARLDYNEYKKTLESIYGQFSSEEKKSDFTKEVSNILLGDFTKILREIFPKKIDFGISENERLTVWFNAWKYDSTKEVWAGLADSIIRQLTDRLDKEQREQFWILVNKDRLNASSIDNDIKSRIFKTWVSKVKRWLWQVITALGSSIGYTFLASINFAFAQNNENFTSPSEISLPEPSLEVVLGTMGIIGSGLFGIVRGSLDNIRSRKEVKNEPASMTFQEYLDIPNYGKEAGFVHRVDEDLRRILKIIQEKYHKPITIFIDDLDRCPPNRVAEVVEAVNRFLSAEFPGCFFVLGMDPELVAAALEEAHSKVIAKLPRHAKHTPIGWRFMDKFVQLPVIIPPPEVKDRDYYLENLIGANSIKDSSDTSDLDTKRKEYEQEAKEILRRAQEKTKNYTDNDETIKKFIRKAGGYFSTNPREIKRFVNLFRFYYFLRTLREERQKQNPKIKIPTNEQIANWIILTLKWPSALRWILRSSGESGFRIGDGFSTKTIKKRLQLLEKISIQNTKDWQSDLKKLLDVNEGIHETWIEDEELREFIGKANLSEAEGVGFY